MSMYVHTFEQDHRVPIGPIFFKISIAVVDIFRRTCCLFTACFCMSVSQTTVFTSPC